MMLRVIDGQHDPTDIVKRLERMLEDAKSGKLTGFVALENHRNTVSWEQAGRWQASEAVFALRLWEMQFLGGW